MHAEKCPICEGKGTVTDHDSQSTGGYMHTCHECNGKGWVEVDDFPLGKKAFKFWDNKIDGEWEVK